MAKNLYDELQRRIERGSKRKEDLLELKSKGLLNEAGNWALGYEEGRESAFEACQDLIASGSIVLLNSFAKKVGEHNTKCEFRKEQLNPTVFTFLLHNEVSEVLESFESKKKEDNASYSCKAKDDMLSTDVSGIKDEPCRSGTTECANQERISSSLAAIIVRCLDMADYYGIDIERAIVKKTDYNKAHPYKREKEF